MWAVMRLRTFRRSTRRERPHLKRKTESQIQRNLERQFGRDCPKNPVLKHIYWGLRRCQMFVCFYEDEVEEENEDADKNPFTTRPPSLEELQRNTGFNRKWLMFLYRNFKQNCSNGRMSKENWREVVRLMFPCAADDRFADRLHRAITKDSGSEEMLFKDLVMCLWELTEGGRTSKYVMEQNGSTTAQFVFGMMGPDDRDRVDESSFIEYVRCVFALSARKHGVSNSLGLPTGSIYRTKSSEEEMKPPTPVIRRFAAEKFRLLDEDHDGYLTVEDIEREISRNRSGLALLSILDCSRLRESIEDTAGCSSSMQDNSTLLAS